jgi:hypothetical protein
MLSFLMVVIFYAFTASMHIFTTEISRTDTSIEAHRAMERMTVELRESLQIISAESTSVSFWNNDLNGDGTVEANEIVTYSWTGAPQGFINRTIQTATQEISTGITNFSLTYNDPDPSNVNFITILIVAQNGSVVSTLESSVDCRNL